MPKVRLGSRCLILSPIPALVKRSRGAPQACPALAGHGADHLSLTLEASEISFLNSAESIKRVKRGRWPMGSITCISTSFRRICAGKAVGKTRPKSGKKASENICSRAAFAASCAASLAACSGGARGRASATAGLAHFRFNRMPDASKRLGRK